MAAREVWRPGPKVWGALGLLSLLAVYKLAPDRLEGHWLVLTPIALAAGVLALRWMWQLNPAVTLCATLVLSIFSGAWFQLGLGGLPLDRAMAVFVVAQLLLHAPGTANTPRIELRTVHLLLALAVMYVLISATAAGTLTSESGVVSLVDMFGVKPYLMFVIAPAVFSGERERRMLLATLVVLGAYLGITAVFESLGPHGLVFPHYITHVDAELPGERANGPFQNSVVEGFATFACAVASAIAFGQWRGRRRYFAAGAGALCVFGCFLTLERGVWIGAVAGLLAATALSRRGRRLLVPTALVGVLAIAALLAVSPGLSHKASSRAGDRTSVWDRQNQTAAGVRMVKARPLLGFGWARYQRDSLDYFRQAPDYPLSGYVLQQALGSAQRPLPLHNTYLAYAVELGILGASLWLFALLCGLGSAIMAKDRPELTPWRRGLLALTIFYLVVAFVDPHEQAFSLLLLWLWAGVAYGSPSLSEQARRLHRTAGRKAGASRPMAARPPLLADGMA